jgi:hypothetical protein
MTTPPRSGQPFGIFSSSERTPTPTSMLSTALNRLVGGTPRAGRSCPFFCLGGFAAGRLQGSGVRKRGGAVDRFPTNLWARCLLTSVRGCIL